MSAATPVRDARRSPGRRSPRRPRRLAPALLAVAGLLAVAVSGCAATAGNAGTSPGTGPAGGSSTATPGAAAAPVNVTALLAPATKYLGVAPVGAPDSGSGVAAFTDAAGKAPDIVEWYANWGAPFDVTAARSVFAHGALPLVAWQPFAPTLAQLAGGISDNYIASWAQAIRLADVPVALDFGHEMNGNWYPWGEQAASAADFVAAWRHIHDIFVRQGATNVIWVWSPNVINPVPRVALQPLYPGDAYVDWIGMDGYYTKGADPAFGSLFGPTMTEVRQFTSKPFLITETAVEPSAGGVAHDVDDLFAAVAERADVLGFVWFDYGTAQGKRADWNLEDDKPAAAAFRKAAASPRFGVDVRAATTPAATRSPG